GHDDGRHDDGDARGTPWCVRGQERFRDVGIMGHDAGMEWTSRPWICRLQRERAMRIAVALAFIMSVVVNATAQQTTSVEQLVATALERSPEIRAARTAVTTAGGEVTQAALRPNPTFTASQMLMTGAQHQSLFEVEWPLDLSRRDAR